MVHLFAGGWKPALHHGLPEGEPGEAQALGSVQTEELTRQRPRGRHHRVMTFKGEVLGRDSRR